MDVWAHNLDEEMAAIAEVVETHPYIAMDTEFPGVARPPRRPPPASRRG